MTATATMNGRAGDWHEVTSAEPCQACEHGHWCSRSADGMMLRCKRVATCPTLGNGEPRKDKTGEPYYLYRIVQHNGNGHAPRAPINKPAEPARADADTLHAAYSAMLGYLTLSSPHRDALRNRGLTDAEIERRQYRSLPISGRARIAGALHAKFGDAVLTVPGIAAAEGKSGPYLTIKGQAGILVPVRDSQGRIGALISRRDEPGEGKYRYLSSKSAGGPGPGARPHVPLGIAGPVELVRVTEGTLKADVAFAVSGVPTIALPSCQPHKQLVPLLHKLGVKTVRLAFDADYTSNRHVAQGLAATHKQLRDAGFAVELEVWPIASGKGIDDVLAAGGQTQILTGEAVQQAIRKALEATREKPAAENTGRRTITIGYDEHRVNDEAIEALATCPHVYQRGGKLVHVVRDAIKSQGIERPKDSPTIVPLPIARLRELLADVARFVTLDSEGKVTPARPPAWCYTAVEARGQWPQIRPLVAIVETPVLVPDGTVLQRPGYDARSGLLYEPPIAFPQVPASPSRDDAVRACDLLLEVVCDFPFKSNAHRSAWLAATLTPFARHAFNGPAPLCLIDANCRGTGKSLLTDCTSHIIAGRAFPRTPMPDNPDETRKRITAIAIMGDTVVLLDNIDGEFGDASLDAALTATSWSDRLLGKNEWLRNLPLLATWYATGNNIQPKGDTARRICHVRLQTREENPEERQGFKHPDLLGWVKQERPRLVTAALTVLRAYCAAGRPPQDFKPWGSYEGWSGIVRSAIVWAGQADPAETRIELRQQSDRDASTLRLLVTGWQEIDPAGTGCTVAAAIKELAEHPTHYEPLRAAFTELTPIGKPFAARGIGMRMKAFRQRVTGGKYLDNTDTREGQVWRVYSVDQPSECDTSGTCDTISATPRETPSMRYVKNTGEGVEKSVTSVTSVTAAPQDDLQNDPDYQAFLNS